MSQFKLADNPTIRDCIEELVDPDNYLRGVLKNMLACRAQHGSAVVRIGITGCGIAPHYQVVKENPEESLSVDDVSDLLVGPADAFHGRSHKPLIFKLEEMQDRNWSGETMSVEEIQNLLGSLRG